MPVVLEGADNLLKELKQWGPNLYKNTRTEIASALKPIAAEAKGYLPREPMRGLRPVGADKSVWQYDYTKVRAGITYKATPSKVNKAGFVALASIINRTPMGAIMETAGRKNPYGQPWVGPMKDLGNKKVSHAPWEGASVVFMNNLGAMYGTGNDRGRYIYRAYENNRGKAQDAVVHAIEKVANEFEINTTLKRAA